MHTRRTVVAVVALCALFVSLWMLPNAAASEGAREPARSLAEMAIGASHVGWQPAGDYEHLVLTVAGPEGLWLRREFAAGQPASLSLFDQNGQRLPDGAYIYELRLVPRKAGSLPEQLLLQAGSFAVRDGSFAAVFEDARRAPQIQNATAPVEVIHDKLITAANECIGALCVTGDDSFPVLRLKDSYNVGILFEDVFDNFSYSRDWLLQANPNLGGPDHFFLQDVDAGTIPFSVQGNAPDYSLVVATGGNVGVGTAIPAKDLTVVSSDTPTLRLEQSFNPNPARSWDLGANHTELFVKDVTGSSSVPFRIKAGAPGDSLVINSTGNVGIGTSSPGDKLSLFNSANVPTRIHIQSTSSGANGVSNFWAQSDTAVVHFRAHGSGRTISHFGVVLGGWSELVQDIGNGLLIGTQNNTPIIMGTNNTNRLQIDGSTGAVTISGNLTVTGTKNFAVADPADARQAIYYTALEGPEAGTYFRGTAKTSKGEAVIELPDYFARLTEPERLTVQLTPLGSWGQLYVAEKTPNRLVVRVPPGSSDLEFDYFVQGVRKGYLDYQVKRPNTLPE